MAGRQTVFERQMLDKSVSGNLAEANKVSPTQIIEENIKSKSSGFARALSNVQNDMLLKTTLAYQTQYEPHINGGYIILIVLGPWINDIADVKLTNTERANSAGLYNLTLEDYQKFQELSPSIAYSIEPGSISTAADNYNLRHHQIDIFSYENKIESVTVNFLEDKSNIVNAIHDNWIKYMKYIKLGIIKTKLSGDMRYDSNGSYFYPVPYFGKIYAFSYNPLDYTPKSILTFVGVYPDSVSFTEDFGTRDHTEHYMKSITYKVADYRHDIFKSNISRIGSQTASDKIESFVKESLLMKEFMDDYIKYSAPNETLASATASKIPTTRVVQNQFSTSSFVV